MKRYHLNRRRRFPSIPVAPSITNTGAPTLSGNGKIGTAHSLSNGTWSVTPDAYEHRYRRSGSVISGATATSYTPVAADDLTNLTGEVRAQKAGLWSAWMASTALAITYQAPTKSANMPATTLTVGLEATLNFAGLVTGSGGTWSIAGGTLPVGMTRTGGVVSGIPTASAVQQTLTLRYTNSGGIVDVSCPITVQTAASRSTYYVATNGTDSPSNGSSASPFRTLSYAATRIVGGDEIIVRNGTYTDTNNLNPPSGEPGKYTIVRAENKFGAVFQHGNYSTIRTGANAYIEISGLHFDLQTGGGGVNVEGGHHIWVHDCKQTGGSFHFFAGHDSDYYTVEDCEAYGIRFSSWWSAMSIYQGYNVTHSADTGFRNIFRRNKIFDCYSVGGPYTDGNGIIIDDCHGTQKTYRTIAFDNGSIEFWRGMTVTDPVSGASGTIFFVDLQSGSWGAGTAAGRIGFSTYTAGAGTAHPADNASLRVGGVQYALRNGSGLPPLQNPPNYTGKTLVEGNLVVGCGGKGIQVFESDYVHVLSNTAAFNGNPAQGRDGQSGTWWADISCSVANYCVFANNVTYTDRTNQAGNQRCYADTGLNGSLQNTIWANNQAFYTSGAQNTFSHLNESGVGPQIGANPLLGANPLFANPVMDAGSADFRPQSGSPILNAGTSAHGVGTVDLLGNVRVQGGAIDLGAYEGAATFGVPQLWMSIPANVFTPPEMVVDGGFGGTGPTGNATSPSGSFQTGQYAIVSGQGRLTNGAAQQGFINIDVPAIAGRTYDASIDIVAGTSGAACGWYIQQADGTTVASGTGAGAKAAAAIVATGAAIRFTFTTGTATAGHTMFFDNMSLRLNQATETALVFEHAVSLGAKGIRTDFDGQWVFFGSSSGRFWTDPDRVVDGAEAAGLEVAFADVSSAAWAAASPSAYPTTQLSAWATCMQAAAARYAGRVKYWEIRNEQNLAGFSATTAGGGSIASCAAAYMTYASAVATALRAGDPNAIIVSNGLSPSPDTVLGSHLKAVDYLTAMYANGASSVFDMIGFHPYSRPLQPENPASYNGWEIMETGIRGAMAAAGDGAKPIFATEFGFPTGGTSSGEQTSVADAATGITSAFALASASKLAIIAYYSGTDRQGSLIPTPSASNEDYYGAWTAALVEKAAITAALRAASAATPAAPSNIMPPSATGATTIGSVLSIWLGRWTPTPGNYERRWKRNGAVVAGETGGTYTTTSADEGANITGEVRARLSGGIWSTWVVSNTIAMDAVGGVSLFGIAPASPEVTNDSDNPYTMGTKFQVAADGQITHLRFYRPAGDTAGRPIRLWRVSDQALLASDVVPLGDASAGWKEVELATPVDVVAGVLYLVAYDKPSGRSYFASGGYFNTARSSNGGEIIAPATGTSPNGVFATDVGTFPTSTFNAASYFADVMYVAA